MQMDEYQYPVTATLRSRLSLRNLTIAALSTLRPQRPVDDFARFGQNLLQVRLALERLGVNLVNVLRARRTSGKPTARRHHLQAADGRSIARGVR